MTAISKVFVAIADTAVDPDSPIDTTLITGFRDNLVHLREWLGASYIAAAAQDHNHDGVNSALVPVGPNLLRNGSFESGIAGWTITQYNGGTVATSTGTPLDGNTSLAFTSTLLANGGGEALSNEYLPVTGTQSYGANGAVQASVAGVSGKMEIVWYDAAKAQISISTLYTSTSLPTTLSPIGTQVNAPASARFMRVKVTGGIPATGTAVGTVYFDGLILGAGAGNIAVPGSYPSGAQNIGGPTASATPALVGTIRAPRAGVYTISMNLSTTTGFAYGQIYINGIAAGAQRSTSSTSPFNFQENLPVKMGDLVQLYAWTTGITPGATATMSLLEGCPVVPA